VRQHGFARTWLERLKTTATDPRSETAREHRRRNSEGRDRGVARNLLLLSPDLQKEIRDLEVPAGRQLRSERAVRRLTENPFSADNWNV
jgi:hypothetical protein